MTILERLKDAEVEIKQLRQELAEQRQENAKLRSDRGNFGIMIRRLVFYGKIPEVLAQQAMDLVFRCCPSPDILRSEEGGDDE